MAGIAAVEVSDELLFLLKKSSKISKLTRGSFDITYTGAGKHWDFKSKPPTLPSKNEIGVALELIGYNKIIIDELKKTAYLPTIGMGDLSFCTPARVLLTELCSTAYQRPMKSWINLARLSNLIQKNPELRE